VIGDLDDVDSATEDGAPNSGDGNFDGAADRNQRDVTSLPEPDGDRYVTISNGSAAQQHLVGSLALDEAGASAPGIELMGGAYDLRVDNYYALPYVVRSEEAGYVEIAFWNGSAWQRSSGYVFDGDALDLDGPFNGTVTVRIAPAHIDHAPPTIECAAPMPTVLLNDPGARIHVDVSDDGAGVDSPVMTVPVSTYSLGQQYTFVYATDRFGNFGYAYCPYRVGVDVEIVSPNPAELMMGKAGKTIPIEWRATDFNGATVTDAAHFASIDTAAVACPRNRVSPTAHSAAGGLSLAGDIWRYGLTTPTSKGCYTVTVHVLYEDATTVFKVT